MTRVQVFDETAGRLYKLDASRATVGGALKDYCKAKRERCLDSTHLVVQPSHSAWPRLSGVPRRWCRCWPTRRCCVPPCFFAVACKATPRWSDRLKWWALSCGLITLGPLLHIR